MRNVANTAARFPPPADNSAPVRTSDGSAIASWSSRYERMWAIIARTTGHSGASAGTTRSKSQTWSDRQPRFTCTVSCGGQKRNSICGPPVFGSPSASGSFASVRSRNSA